MTPVCKSAIPCLCLFLSQGSYYHSSFLCMAAFNFCGPLLGLSFVTGSLPHSPQLVKALTNYAPAGSKEALSSARVDSLNKCAGGGGAGGGAAEEGQALSQVAGGQGGVGGEGTEGDLDSSPALVVRFQGRWSTYAGNRVNGVNGVNAMVG